MYLTIVRLIFSFIVLLTNEWEKFLLIKENLALKIKKEVKELN